jgi:L-ascorbate metabolism protein UlaG (beta-lactamase superfamily)
MISSLAALGAAASGERLARMRRSPNWRRSRFVNALPAKTDISYAVRQWLGGAPNREPKSDLPVVRCDAASFAEAPRSGLRATWLGHSSMLVELGRQRFLTDPVFSDRISPSRLFGPRRFFQSPMAADELPPLDAVVISHDHFDHLDMPTIRALGDVRYVTPLGVGAHLERWGVPPTAITELDWWQATRFGAVELVCTPARHFSGRSLGGRDATLWASFAFVTPTRRVFFSGDTGMFPGFSEIGSALGPFDLSVIEAGAYNAAWADVHLGPEQAVQAHAMLRGQVLLPVHWGTYNLALHGWTEPAERARVAAAARGATLALPRPGESIDPMAPAPVERWWPELPWQRAEDAPVVSSGLGTAEFVPA